MNSISIDLIDGCATLEDAVRRVRTEQPGDGSVWFRHRIPAGFSFPLHTHAVANEWIVVTDGSAEFVTLDANGDARVEELHGSADKTMVVSVPAGCPHTLRSLSDELVYAVIRDTPDDC